MVRNAVARHSGDARMVEQRFRFSVSKFMCKLVDAHGNALTLDSFEPEEPSSEEPTGPADVSAQIINQMNQNGAKLSGLKGALQCKFCPFRASRPFHMEFHAKHHKPQEGATFSCKKCPFWVNSKKSLVKHLYVHNHFEKSDNGEEENGNEEEISDEANGTLNESQNIDASSQLIIEPQREEEPQDYRCNSCPFIGGNKAQLQYHRNFHKSNPNAEFKCDKCSYAVSYEHLLNQHVKVHQHDYGKNQSMANGSQKSAAQKMVTPPLNTNPPPPPPSSSVCELEEVEGEEEEEDEEEDSANTMP